MELKELIETCIRKRIVCLAGGGGKTTLMYEIAEEASKAGKRVIATTTTHILKPDNYYAGDIDTVKTLWNQGYYAVVGETDRNDEKKLVFPNRESFRVVEKDADLILVEADGAKRFPCKVPGPHEPVILPECGLVIGVMGMSALDKSLGDACFRFGTDGKWLDAEENDLIDESIAVKILSSKLGTKKGVCGKEYIAVLNQCDDEITYRRALSIASVLEKEHGILSVCCKLKG